jgi:2-polyprenyl-3-methyl-5-hydroxy-6-metoxy-1,4-benzoquinol methylase
MSTSTLVNSFGAGDALDRPAVDRANLCKVCHDDRLEVFEHTARCRNCGVLLFFPYPTSDMLVRGGDRKALWLDWYCESGFRNARNFANMIEFALGDVSTAKDLAILDYGGGGGQFALTALTHFPRAIVSMTDIDNAALLPQYRSANHPIPFERFEADATRFDIIFMNDVFEHVEHPEATLLMLAGKLKPGGRLFVDTPKTFWLFPVLRVLCPPIYRKLCRGTVTREHLQIWTRRAFHRVAGAASLRVTRYAELSEFTMPPEFYLRSMGIENPLLVAAGRLFYRSAGRLAKNKIMAVLERS